ncbi:hypothetical protein DEI92_10255 [Curtobacterium sp. MCBD17_034]|nr:hypothetical protein DEI92_10255 [Curtobacterium sp. MCBD17_034]PZM34449.1 hypothetical protein DEI90_06825 [Curtobacterium sp. MCBD17_031]
MFVPTVIDEETPMRSSPRTTPPRRRLAASVASAAIGLLALTACSSGASSSDASDGRIHLTMYQQWGGGHEQAVLDRLIERYESLHPRVEITETPVTNNAKILASITGGDAPDIVDLGNSLPLGGWAAAGALQPLDRYIRASGLDTSTYIPSAMRAMTSNGKTYGLPFQVFTSGLIYNTKLLAEAGITKPPTTLQELATDAAKLTERNADGTITQMGFLPTYPGPDQGQTCPLISYGYAFGGGWTSSDGTATPTRAANVAALTWEQSFFKRYGVANVQNFISSAGSYLTSGDPLESGKLAMMFDGPWSVQYASDNRSAAAGDLRVVPLPASSTAPSRAGSTYVDANAQVIPTGAEHPKAAFDFIKWETTNASETASFSDTVGNIPQLKDTPSFALASDPQFAKYIGIAKSANARSWTQTATSSNYGTQLCEAQDNALLNGQSATAALEAVTGR